MRVKNPPKCSCTNGGEPILLDGRWVSFRDPACRVHPTTLSFDTQPSSVETIIGNWKDREDEE